MLFLLFEFHLNKLNYIVEIVLLLDSYISEVGAYSRSFVDQYFYFYLLSCLMLFENYIVFVYCLSCYFYF